MIKIIVDGVEITCANMIEAQNILYQIKKNQILLKSPRCDKCVYLKETCGQTDKDGQCWKYKRDPPDGGYYG